MLGARQVVNQIVQQNLQGSGAFSGAMVEQLTQILANCRTSKQSGPLTSDPTGYDWDTILSQARSTMSIQQMEGIETSLKYYRAQKQMAAMEKR